MLRVGGAAALLLDQSLLGLATRNDKVIVLAVTAPRPGGHVLRVHKLPIGHVSWLQPKVVAHCRRNIQTSAMVEIGFGTFVAKNILEVIGAKRTAVFPLRVTSSIAFADRDPVMPAN